MKKIFTLIAMVLMAVGVNAGEVDILSKFTYTWGSAEEESITNNADGTITYNGKSWGGLAAWIGGEDWSSYSSLTFEFSEATTVDVQIAVGDLKKYGSAGLTKLTLDFAEGDVSNVQQVALQLAAKASVTITRVYLTEAVNYYSTNLWEGECDFGTEWKSGFKIASDKFSNVVEGDILEFVYTTSSSATYWQFNTQFADLNEPLTSNSADLNEWNCANVGGGSTSYRITLNASDIAKLKVNGLYTCGYACIVTKVNLLSLTEKTPDPTKQLSLTTLDSGWDAEYNAETKTITITGDDGGGKGWGYWNTAADYSYFDNLVIEFDLATTTGGWVTVEYAADGATSSYIEFNPGATCVVVPLDATNKNQVKQIYISGAKDATYTLKAAYLAISSATPSAQLGTPPTWTVAGATAILGSSWDLTDTNNDMTSTDGVTYTLVKENCTLEKGTNYEYKVAKNHAWNPSYPSVNAVLTVTETAIYTVTFTFNSTTHEVSASTVKTGEAAAIEHTYDVKGNFNDDSTWSNTYTMTKGDDGKWSVTIENLKAGNYEFKVRQDGSWDVAYPSSNYELAVTSDGSVTITFDPATNEITVAQTPTGISTINAAKEQSGVRYNLAGQKVDASYKGVVIENGRKMVQK